MPSDEQVRAAGEVLWLAGGKLLWPRAKFYKVARAALEAAEGVSKPDPFQTLVNACWEWTEHHMDQWEKFTFKNSLGTPIYVTVSMMADYPSSFDQVDIPCAPASKDEADG